MKKKKKGLVTQVLENLSKDIFKEYYPYINKLIGTSPGVYALYNRKKLYYVGKSTALNRRVKHHLRDRHLSKWTHFSLYLVRKTDYIHDIESLIVRIANPQGNRVIPKGKGQIFLLKKLKRMIREAQVNKLKRLFGDEIIYKRNVLNIKNKKLKKIIKLIKKINRKTNLYAKYKGKMYRGILYENGLIKVNNKKYNSLSAAAKSIVKRDVNGWRFWKIKNKKGKLIPVSKYI